ncbi:hypothetical protein HO133_010829 [Letharia lupina]|uniref:Tetraspanin Tsp3 n=1 Tax=Letharia lupina TaxID=560253 RepID=A0A8H6FDV7_9LECA|nr:uncharacterized protein HO133_010829 [Letharia lupina]KAF6224254.1 hypothetical protein HO133_010829 [Letharia lupina]
MPSSSQALSFLVPVLLVGLVVTGGIALYRIRAFSLPISTVTATATIILPVITGVTLRGAQRLRIRENGSNARAKMSFSWPALIVLVLLIIYETVIATLALTHVAPPSELICGLERQWGALFSSKNADAIRRIQEQFQCCGFRNVQDRAWPFPDRSHTARACVEAFGRGSSCLGGWRQMEQVTGGLILLVAVVAFLLKLLMLVLYRTQSPFLSSAWTARSSLTDAEGEDNGLSSGNGDGDNIRGRIVDAYHDEPPPEIEGQAASSQPEERDTSASDRRGLLVQPSGIQNERNEWREG